MWTLDNTEGFSQEELNELNAALEMLMQDDFAEPSNLNDMLTDVWRDGMTADDLYTAVREISNANA